MAKLSFKDKLHKVEINDVEFFYDPMDMGAAEKTREISKELEALRESASEGDISFEEAKRIMELYQIGIETILGEGSLDKMMHDVPKTSGSLLQAVYLFLLEESKKFNKEIIDKKRPANRYQQHPATKK